VGARRNVDEAPAPAIDPKEEIVAIWLAQHSGFPKLFHYRANLQESRDASDC
jgi:hypothetical protein